MTERLDELANQETFTFEDAEEFIDQFSKYFSDIFTKFFKDKNLL